MIALLDKDTPLFSRELVSLLRLASLAIGLGLLVAGSIFLPSSDWDIPLCFVMGIPAYVFAPWAFRQVYYFRWVKLIPAAFVLWLTIDGSYSLYWWLRDFDALSTFRSANYFYCIWIFWACGFVWNIDLSKLKLFDTAVDMTNPTTVNRTVGRKSPFLGVLCAAFLAAMISVQVATILFFHDDIGVAFVFLVTAVVAGANYVEHEKKNEPKRPDKTEAKATPSSSEGRKVVEGWLKDLDKFEKDRVLRGASESENWGPDNPKPQTVDWDNGKCPYKRDSSKPLGSKENPVVAGVPESSTHLVFSPDRKCWILTDGLGNGWIR